MSTLTQTAIQRSQAVSTAIHINRAKMASAMSALCGLAGFTLTAEAVQAELQTLCQREHDQGRSPPGWIG